MNSVKDDDPLPADGAGHGLTVRCQSTAERHPGRCTDAELPTNETPADGPTKALPSQKFERFRGMLNLDDIWSMLESAEGIPISFRPQKANLGDKHLENVALFSPNLREFLGSRVLARLFPTHIEQLCRSPRRRGTQERPDPHFR